MRNRAPVVPFNFDSNEIRTMLIDDQPWFIAADVCKALGLGNPSEALKGLDADERGISSTDTPSGKQRMLRVNESGLYILILRSRDAIKKGSAAHRFRKWITSEVLPTLRKTGTYTLPVSPERPASTTAWLESPLPPPGIPSRANGWNETIAYFRRCREAAAAAGVQLPVWDDAIEARIATQLASMMVADYRWLMSLDRDGTPVLRGVTRGTHLVDVNDPEAVRQLIRLHLPVEQLLAVAAEAVDRARQSTLPAKNKDLTK